MLKLLSYTLTSSFLLRFPLYPLYFKSSCPVVYTLKVKICSCLRSLIQTDIHVHNHPKQHERAYIGNDVVLVAFAVVRDSL